MIHHNAPVHVLEVEFPHCAGVANGAKMRGVYPAVLRLQLAVLYVGVGLLPFAETCYAENVNVRW